MGLDIIWTYKIVYCKSLLNFMYIPSSIIDGLSAFYFIPEKLELISILSNYPFPCISVNFF